MPGGDVSAGPDKKEFWVKMKWKLPGERSVFRLPLNFLYYRKWTAPGFEKGLSYINAHPELRNEEALLSRTGGKEVWKMPLPQEAGGVTAEKIQVETDIGEEGGIECTGVELWFAYPSQEERALAMLRGVLGEELSIRTQTGGG